MLPASVLLVGLDGIVDQQTAIAEVLSDHLDCGALHRTGGDGHGIADDAIVVSVVALASSHRSSIAVSDSAGALVLRLLFDTTVVGFPSHPAGTSETAVPALRALPWRFFGGAMFDLQLPPSPQQHPSWQAV